MLCIINCQYTHNQGKFCQNFQFLHIYSTVTSFSVNLHHFPVDKNEISVKITEISVGIKRNFSFRIQNCFSFGISEISPEIPFPPDGLKLVDRQFDLSPQYE